MSPCFSSSAEISFPAKDAHPNFGRLIFLGGKKGHRTGNSCMWYVSKYNIFPNTGGLDQSSILQRSPVLLGSFLFSCKERVSQSGLRSVGTRVTPGSIYLLTFPPHSTHQSPPALGVRVVTEQLSRSLVPVLRGGGSESTSALQVPRILTHPTSCFLGTFTSARISGTNIHRRRTPEWQPQDWNAAVQKEI